MKIRFTKDIDNVQLFDYKSGKAVSIEQTNFLWRKSGPLLLDVSLTSRCLRCCSFCYRHAQKKGYDMPTNHFLEILKQAKECGVQQIAFGGGEPTLHPNFCEILQATYENGIIPNYSTNGDNLSERVLKKTKECCGAMAISVYEEINKYQDIILKILSMDIRLNLHFIMKKDLLKKYIDLLHNPPVWIDKINSIIFLNFKPANNDFDMCLNLCPQEDLLEFFSLVKNFNRCGIGFDTCSVSYLINHLSLDESLYNYCEAGRTAAYIREDSMMFPCSFYIGEGIDLKKQSLKEAWVEGKSFIEHRHVLNDSNYTCINFKKCHGGCQLYSINYCKTC